MAQWPLAVAALTVLAVAAGVLALSAQASAGPVTVGVADGASRVSVAEASDFVQRALTASDNPVPTVRAGYKAPPVSELPQPEPPPANAYGPVAGGRIGSIEIPRIGMTQGLFKGVTLTGIDRGPSHWPGSAMPGQVGNAVIAGHRVTHSKPFRNVDQLRPGDSVVFRLDDGSSFRYAVTSTEIIDPRNLTILHPTTDATATLFACHPPGSARQRIVVHLRLADDPSVPASLLD